MTTMSLRSCAGKLQTMPNAWPSSCAVASHRTFATSASTSKPQPSQSPRNVASVRQVPQRLPPAFPPPILKASKLAAAPVPSRKERRTAQKAQRKLAQKQAVEDSLSARLGVSTGGKAPLVRVSKQFKTFKPITPSIRWVRHAIATHLHKGRPERGLTMAKRSTAGRNHHGHVTVRGRGGGHRRRIRLVDFYRKIPGPQTVLRIEYDPGRSAHIALLEHDETKQRSYILASDGLRAGDKVRSYRTGPEAEAATEGTASLDLGIFRTHAIRSGNVLPLRLIPIGTMIHAVSLKPTGPAKLVRSAGASGQLVAFGTRSKAPSAQKAESASLDAALVAAEQVVAKDAPLSAAQISKYAQVRLQSGEVRWILADCAATIGRVSNIDHEHERLGKAGRSRWLGIKPKVRGVAMNAVDHPHGGGRGKSKSNMHPRSIYGHIAKFARTRKPGTKNGNRMVIRERPRRNGKRLGKA